jgi:PAS domain S-box-containing protein
VRLYRLTVAAGIAISIGVGSLTAVVLWSDRGTRLADAARQDRDVARTLSEHAARSFGMIDVLLDQLADRLAVMHQRGTLQPDTIAAQFARYQARMPQISAMGLLDARGRNFGAVPGLSPPGVDLSDRDYYRIPALGYDGLYITEPFISRISGRPVVTVARRVAQPDGTLVGVVTAVVDQTYFRNVFDATIDYGGNLIALLSPGGKVMAASSQLADRLRRDPFALDVNADGDLPGLGVRAHLSPVPGTPLQIAVANDLEHELARWREWAWQVGGAAVLLIATILSLTLLLARAGWRERQMREELASGHERLNLAMQGTSAGLWDWDLKAGTIYRSPRLQEMLGDHAVDGSNHMDLVHPDDRGRMQDMVRAHLRGRTPYDIELRVRRADGRYAWLHSRGQAVWDSSGRAVRMAGSSEDVTVRKTIELALEESRAALRNVAEELNRAAQAERAARAELAKSVERFELVVQATSAGIWDWDGVSDRLYTSDRLREICGYAHADSMSMQEFLDRAHPDDAVAVRAQTRAMFKQRIPFSLEYRSRRDDGTYVWVYGRAIARFDESGRAIRVTGSTEDIDARKRAESGG